jgi:hypothetical protein
MRSTSVTFNTKEERIELLCYQDPEHGVWGMSYKRPPHTIESLMGATTSRPCLPTT